MMDLANIFALLLEGAQDSQSFFASVSDSLSKLGVGSGELSVGGVAVALAAVWVFVRVVRTVVTILFAACILLLVLQLTGVVDSSAVWEMVQGWLSPSEPAAY